ncbi:MAG: recombinase family protein [Sedimentisphaerales bacterium]|nr:recombinase family protein [Sedimentisphaerales bacterium]
MKAALYTRVSSQEQKLGTSLDEQRADLEGWASYKGYDYQLYSDEGKTGTTGDREALQRLMSDAKAKRIDVVVVRKIDRFFRNSRLLLNYIEDLRQLGIKFVSTEEGFDTNTPMGNFALQMMSSVAELERNMIVERTREGRYARYRQGRWACGQPLYGYQYNHETGKLEIKENEAQIVRRIFNLYVFDRLGVGRIARKLNEENVLPRGADTKHKARQWYAGATRDLISHPGYKGEHPLKIDLPAIVEPKLWEMAQQRRKDNRRLHNRNGSPWLLQGMVKCGLCGHSLACSWAHNTRRVYSCRGRLQLENVSNGDKCSLNPIDAEWLENAVWEKVNEALSCPSSLIIALEDSISKLKARAEQLERSIKPIDCQLSEIRQKKERLAENWVTGALGKDRLNELKDKLDSEEKRLSGIRQEIDPAQISELEDARTWLTFWEKRRKELDLRLNLIPEGVSNEEEQQSAQAYKVAEVLLGMADIEDYSLRDEVGSPTSKRQLLDYLQCLIVPYSDRIEIKAFLPINHIDYEQDYSSVYTIARCRRSG